MSTTSTQPAGPVAVPSFARLYVTELHRFAARRFMRVTLVLTVLGYLLLVGVLWHTHDRPTAAGIAQATRERDATVADIAREVAQCANSAPAGQSDAQCGPTPTTDDFPVEQFLAKHPLGPNDIPDTALALGVGVAAIGFVLGATSIGAEWSSRNIVAWLFWEPRRLRLLAAKALALISAMLAVSAAVQLSWAVIGRVLLHYRGVPVSTLGARAAHYSTDLAALQVRAGVLVVATALLAFGVAHLLRNTAAAFGFGFLYFAVIENAVRIVLPRWSPYVLSEGIAAWVQRGGVDVYRPERLDRRTGQYVPHVIHLSNVRGGVTLLIYVGVVAVLAVASFRRRDIT